MRFWRKSATLLLDPASVRPRLLLGLRPCRTRGRSRSAATGRVTFAAPAGCAHQIYLADADNNVGQLAWHTFPAEQLIGRQRAGQRWSDPRAFDRRSGGCARAQPRSGVLRPPTSSSRSWTTSTSTAGDADELSTRRRSTVAVLAALAVLFLSALCVSRHARGRCVGCLRYACAHAAGRAHHGAHALMRARAVRYDDLCDSRALATHGRAVRRYIGERAYMCDM